MENAVKLSKIIEELGQMDGMEIYLHRPTGTIYYFFEGESEFSTVYSAAQIANLPPKEKEKVEIAFSFEEHEADFVLLPSKYEVNEYGIMEDFCDAINNEMVQNTLWNSIQGRGAFRKFRNTIDRFKLTNQWYAFKERAFFEVAIEWCIDNEIAYIDDRPATKSTKEQWNQAKIEQEWKRNAAKQTDASFRFLTSLKFKSADRVDKVASVLHQEAFEKIDCTQCANCCKTAKPTLSLTDVERISTHLKISVEELERNYLIPSKEAANTWDMNALPCPFLNQENLCTIYEVRPLACQDYPNTHKEGFTSRRYGHTANTEICPASYYIVERMKENFGG